MLKNYASVTMGVIVGISFVGAVSTFYPWSEGWIIYVVNYWKEFIDSIFGPIGNEDRWLWGICVAIFFGYTDLFNKFILSIKYPLTHRDYSDNLLINLSIVLIIYFILIIMTALLPVFAIFLSLAYTRAYRYDKWFFLTFNVLVLLFFILDVLDKLWPASSK